MQQVGRHSRRRMLKSECMAVLVVSGFQGSYSSRRARPPGLEEPLTMACELGIPGSESCAPSGRTLLNRTITNEKHAGLLSSGRKITVDRHSSILSLSQSKLSRVCGSTAGSGCRIDRLHPQEPLASFACAAFESPRSLIAKYPPWDSKVNNARGFAPSAA